jgi:predicted ATPase
VLVGRDAELGALERALEVVEGGASCPVGIVGEPGIGKSRLLGELGGRAVDRGHVVIAGRAAELERDVPFALWGDALDGYLGERGAAVLEGLAADELADLAVALPAVARTTAVAPAVAVERHRVARAVRGLLARLAAARPVTLLLDGEAPSRRSSRCDTPSSSAASCS